jgi:hypothetical protein
MKSESAQDDVSLSGITEPAKLHHQDNESIAASTTHQ